MAVLQREIGYRGWTGLDRAAMASLAILVALGTPGLGPETRHPANEGLLSMVAGVMFVLPLVAVALSLRRARAAAWLGMAAGLLLGLIGLLDLAGLMIGPPPVGMIAVDGLLALVGAATLVRCWLLLRAA